ncbi:MAG TPA: hypothetical protein VHA11_15630 [Bryobacteraceae bacterium]|nr:hypothetical protein [Bryobacteraceae bacterium]
MGFLDNLENSLKSLENADERGERGNQNRGREAERLAALAAAPNAERLKSGPFTSQLLEQAAVAGHAARTKIHIAWMGTSLRLEARGRKLDLRPTPEGVLAVFSENGTELRSFPVDLEGSPEALVRELLQS